MVGPSKRRVGTWVALGAVAVAAAGAGLVFLHSLSSAPAEPTLGAADRAPFVRRSIDGQAWLVHPTVGFRVRDPGAAFVLDPSGSAATGLPATWLYRDDATGRAVSILLDLPPRNTHSAFNSYVDGARVGMRRQGAVIDSVHATFFALRGECEIDAHVGDEHIVAVTQVFDAGRIARTYRVGVSGPAELRDVVVGFAAPP